MWGSNGSVIPLFKEQYATGAGAVTLRKSSVFQTISEACQLVLEGARWAKAAEITV
jgi:FlaA1/EpsC-like NDP-sugar epimerase